MLNSGTYEFQFTYEDDQTPVIRLTYDAMNKQNQVRFKKQDDGGNYLAGAKLKVVRKDNGGLVEEWISGGQDHYITGIKAGEYTLIEVETPGDGYSLALDIDFTGHVSSVCRNHLQSCITINRKRIWSKRRNSNTYHQLLFYCLCYRGYILGHTM